MELKCGKSQNSSPKSSTSKYTADQSSSGGFNDFSDKVNARYEKKNAFDWSHTFGAGVEMSDYEDSD
jgi:hypothetical protein